MLRTDIILLKPDAVQEQVLHTLAEQSALLWNTANYQKRQAYFNHAKLPSYNKQAYELKSNQHYQAIGAGNAQALLMKNRESWSSFWELKKMQKAGTLPPNIRIVRPPGYWKDRDTKQTEIKMICIRDDCYKIKKNAIHLMGTKHGFKPMNIPFAGNIRPGKYGRLEIHYDSISNRWYAHVPVHVKVEVKHNTTERIGSIDLGICNIVAFYTNDSKPILYSGRAILSDWVYHTKNIAKLQSMLKQGKHTSKKIRLLFRVRRRRFRHSVNAMLKDLFNRIQAIGITKLVVGDLKDISRSTDKGKVFNQKASDFWSVGWITKRIQEYGEQHSIEVVLQSERNTSKTCCLCGQQHNGRVHRGLHQCKENHTLINGDVNGAVLIQVAVRSPELDCEAIKQEISSSRVLANPLMLRWDYHQWH